MTFRKMLLWFAGACVLLIVAAAPIARAYVQPGQVRLWQDGDKNPGTKLSRYPGWEKLPLTVPGRPLRGGNNPLGEASSAPIPEPGTLTLTSMGLLALGAAMRKVRGAKAPPTSLSL